MEYRRPRHPQHGVYHHNAPYLDIQNQSDSMTYSQCHPNYNDTSPWVMWHGRASSPVVSLKKGKCCSAMLGIIVFLAILTVMGIAGLAIYMGAMKLDSAQYLVFDGSLRVISGDSFLPSLSDHSNEIYKKKFHFYKMLLQTIFKKSELGSALKHSTITGFAKGSLVVFFRLILDRRKIPKPLTNLEERARKVILQEFSSLVPSSPLHNLKIDSNQIYIRRHFDNKGSERVENENINNNSTLQIKNGVLLKTPLHSQSPKYKSTLGDLVTSKPQRTESGGAQGSFVVSSSESSKVENNSTEKPRPVSEHTTKTLTSLTTQLTHIKKTKPSSSIHSQAGTVATTETFSNRFQHSPALNALLMHIQTTTHKPTESTQRNVVNVESDLITLSPYNSYSEEPWKPMLPENFTRYPQRRPPTTTESYNSEGIGVVEVVLDQEDIDTFYAKVPLTTEEPTTINSKKEYLNLHNPLGDRQKNISFGSRPGDNKVQEKSIFGPRSNDRISSFALNIDSTKFLKEFETSIIHTNGEDIVRSLDSFSDNSQTIPKPSSTSQYLPDFPIVQQFHNLDTLLRSFNLRSPHSTSSTEDKIKEHDYLENSTVNLPFTLLPVRSNLGIGKPLRPRPTISSLDEVTKNNYLKISSSLTPGKLYTQHSLKTPNPSEPLSKLMPFRDLKNYETFSDVEFTTASDYSINTNYFENYFSTISPTNFEGNYKPADPIKISKGKNSESIPSTLDYVTGVTEITNQESTTEDNTNLSKESTLEKKFLHLTSPPKEEILSTPESLEELTTNIYDLPEVYRKPKMVTQFNTIVLPIKLLTTEDELKEDVMPSNIANSPKIEKHMESSNFETYFGQQVNDKSVGLHYNKDNNSMYSSNLKNNSMQDYLENVIYNISSEGSDDFESFRNTSESSEGTTFFPFFTSQLNDSASDTNLASNRKYDKTDKNSITMDTSNLRILSNFSFPYNDKSKNLSKTANESLKSAIESQNILKISTQLKQSSLNENRKEEESPPKNLFSSNNYVVNKSGFTILTKLLNKIPEQIVLAAVKNMSLQNNHSECFGNLSLKCGSGECVSALSRCNHLVDCTDGSDEKNCSCAEFLQSQFLTRKICDGVVDCWDFSDENNCEWCVPGQFVCTNSRVCIDRDRLCDGERDCPNGDDEKNCVAITPDLPQANTLAYISEGYLMIRKSGHWGKLCTENFDSMNHNFKTSWSMEDLGKAVCKSLTFRKFESANIVNDKANNHTSYFELSFTKGSGDGRNTRTAFSFVRTNCSKKEVINVSCSDLECGIRPQANTQWTSKRVSGSTRHSRIVGGGNAGPGSWPWQAALYKEGEFQCGATLISDKWLLSAGHCFYHALDDFWVARLGALRRGTSLPSPYEQLQPVSRIILHPGYVDAGFINDISLLEMKNPVSFTNYVRPICLPEPTMQVKDGTLCTVVGWGQLFEVGRIFPDTLQEVQLPIISTAECRKRTLFLPLYRVTENMFCAGYDRGGRDACLGDSGGPLMCQELDGRWSLLGVTSNGYGCARANRPGVYTKVSNYVNWVKMNMASVNSTSNNKRNLTCNGHRCPLGECLSPARICNGYMECSDGSDEKDCW